MIYPIKILYDVELMRPGCPLLAAGLGANTMICHEFDSRMWLTHPTPGLHVYELHSETQLAMLIHKTLEHWNCKHPQLSLRLG